jgi:putative flippase GtrA
MKKHNVSCELLQVIRYAFFGVLAAVINYLCYIALRRLDVGIVAANAIAWVVGTVFAYYTSKLIVFRCDERSFSQSVVEATEFYSTRALMLLFEEALMIFTVSVLSANDYVAKVFAVIITGILNYFVSKLLVFRKRERHKHSQ